jgi:hypothetical protein
MKHKLFPPISLFAALTLLLALVPGSTQICGNFRLPRLESMI